MNTRQSTPWLGFMILLLAAGCSQTEPFSAKETFPSLNNGGSPPPPPPRSPGPPTTNGLDPNVDISPDDVIAGRPAHPDGPGTPQAGGEASRPEPGDNPSPQVPGEDPSTPELGGEPSSPDPGEDPPVPGDEPDET